MSISGFQYRIRPNKHVDRELFSELVARFVSGRPENFAYISMGADHVLDHAAIYRRCGLRNLYSFDKEPAVVRRARFNRPVQSMVCRTHTSEELLSRFDEVPTLFSAERVIVWLDYQGPRQRHAQLTEFMELLGRLKTGDLARITLDLDTTALQNRIDNASEKKGDRAQRLADALKENLGTQFFPFGVDRVTKADLPLVISDAITTACDRASTKSKRFVPLLRTTYQDTSRMLTVAVEVVGEDGASQLPSWSFRPRGSADIIRIETPVLSPRERYAIESMLERSPSSIVEELEFATSDWTDYISCYQRLQRFQPRLQETLE